jgi:hypothetical protein
MEGNHGVFEGAGIPDVITTSQTFFVIIALSWTFVSGFAAIIHLLLGGDMDYQPCWKFWHPMSGISGGIFASVVYLIILNLLGLIK